MLNKHMEWSSDLPFNTSPLNMSTNIVNLCEIMQEGREYEFPDHLNGIENKTKVFTELKIAAIQSGYNLQVRPSAFVNDSPAAGTDKRKVSKYPFSSVFLSASEYVPEESESALSSAVRELLMRSSSSIFFVFDIIDLDKLYDGKTG